jgi:hypothetical protein
MDSISAGHGALFMGWDGWRNCGALDELERYITAHINAWLSDCLS